LRATMRVAVTGGAGYIGSTLIRDLLKEGHEVTSLDNQTTGNYEHVKRLKGSAKLIVGDIRSPEDLDSAFKGMDAVVHMAALSDLDACNDKPDEAVSVNVYGTHRVVESALKNGMKRLVFCSSAAVYGTPASIPVTEETPTHPLNLYGVTKLAGEKILDAAHANNGLETVNLRFGNVYGVGLYTNWVGVIPKFVALALDGKPLTIYGDGESTRDFVHVEDITRAIVLSLTTKGIEGETFNIGNETTTVNEIAAWVSEETRKATGNSVKTTHLPPRPGETKEFSYDTSKISDAIGFRPKWQLRDGVKQIIRYRLTKK
jgi:UDP-glucose 4-epimerase